MTATTFSPIKLILFSICNIVGGVLQVWVLFVALATLGKQHDLTVLLGDGGLFFFSTPVIVNSGLILLAETQGTRSSSDIAATAFSFIGGLITALVVYTAVLTNRFGMAAPFHDHIGSQVVCAVIAFGYSVYVAGRTGYFTR